MEPARTGMKSGRPTHLYTDGRCRVSGPKYQAGTTSTPSIDLKRETYWLPLMTTPVSNYSGILLHRLVKDTIVIVVMLLT